MKRTVLIILLAIAANFGKLTAQTPAVMVSDKPGWHKIGEKTVDFTRDRDEISVIGATVSQLSKSSLQRQQSTSTTLKCIMIVVISRS